MIIDSHAHLDYPQLSADLPAVLARAGEAGVDSVISIGVKLTTAGQPRLASHGQQSGLSYPTSCATRDRTSLYAAPAFASSPYGTSTALPYAARSTTLATPAMLRKPTWTF